MKKDHFLKYVKIYSCLCTQPIIFHWMFTKLYLSWKTIGNLNAKFSKHPSYRIAYTYSNN